MNDLLQLLFESTTSTLFTIGAIVLLVLIFIGKIAGQNNRIKTIRRLTEQQVKMTPDEFFTMRQSVMKTYPDPKNRPPFNISGIYVLHNTTKNKYYVGQGKKVIDRVNQHFRGKGNGDIYVDYRNGDRWTIQIIDLKSSPYNNLNELERNAIETYNAYERGYNKTRGNKIS